MSNNDAYFFREIEKLQKEIRRIKALDVPSGNWVAWTPSYTGFSADPTVPNAYYFLQGKVCIITIAPTAGTSNDTVFTISLPFTAVTRTNMAWQGLARVRDASVNRVDPGLWRILSGATTMSVFKDAALGTWTASGTKNAIINSASYEIA